MATVSVRVCVSSMATSHRWRLGDSLAIMKTLPQHLVEVPRLLVQVPVVLLELLPQVVEVRVRPREAIEDVLGLLSGLSSVGR